MNIVTAFSGSGVSVVCPFFFNYDIDHHIFRHTEFVSIWWPSLGVSCLHGNDAGFLGLSLCLLEILLRFFFFFFFHPTNPKSVPPRPMACSQSNAFDAKLKTKKGGGLMYKLIDFLKVFCFFPRWLYHFKTSRLRRSLFRWAISQ